MIKIKNLRKKYNEDFILKNINISFPEKGLITILGDSGSGKTTLLNIIGGLLDFKGEVLIKKRNINTLSDEDKSSLRLNEIGFVFQDYKLFEEQTIYNNVILPHSSIFNKNLKENRLKVIEALEVVNLKKSINEKVNNLSGGEKQKVAIARSIINSPKILLCDEPTGSLDDKNKVEIMNILKRISKSNLVIVVSHDIDLANAFSNRIITISDGRISSDKTISNCLIEENVLMKKNKSRKKRESIAFSFLFKHIVQKIKVKKFRSLISLTAMSLGLVGFGLTLNLSSSISSNIKSTFASVIDEERILIYKKDISTKNESRKAASINSVNEIFSTHKEFIDDIGINYILNYENVFETSNELLLDKATFNLPITGINARSVNEFRWLDFIATELYPFEYKEIKNDEVILGLTIDMINTICFEYNLERKVESLSSYLQLNPIPLTFYFENLSWNMSLSFSVNMVGFTLEERCSIYHSNHLWNQYVFEEVLKLPTSDNVTGVTSSPWVLRKLPYLQLKKDKRDEFLSLSISSFSLNEFVFEIGSGVYFPYKEYNKCSNYKYKLLVFKNSLKGIMPIYSPQITKKYKELSKPIYGSYGGYFIYPEIMMSGFARPSYFSKDLDLIEKVIDDETNLNPSNNEVTSLPNGVMSAHYSDSLDEGIIFDVIAGQKLNGDLPNNFDEIIISSSLSEKLFKNENPIGKDLHIAFCDNEYLVDDLHVKEFKTSSIKISGIINDRRDVIFHNSDWAIFFFVTHFEVSRFSLDLESISFKISDKNLKEKFIDDFNSKNSPFPFLKASDPLESFSSGVDEVCFYLEIALMSFSLITIIVSILLLAMTNYLFILENKKDFGLIRCLGLSKFEAKKLVFANSFIYAFISFLMSSFELVFSTLLINIEMAFISGGPILFSFNPISLVFMFILSLLISIISSFVFSRKIGKITPLEALKS